MKQKVNFLKKNGLVISLSFIFPVVLMILAYYQICIYPGSERTILASDSSVQYANFHASIKNVLQGKQSIFYTWSGSLGLNYWALSAYYLNGIFTPLVAFFDNSTMPDTLYYLTLLKFGASGVAFWFFAHHTFKLNRWLIVGLSVSYSLMSYAVSYSPVIMWLDTFVYLPLIFWGIHRLIEQKKPSLLFVSYLMLFISSYYMGFMVALFTFLYVCMRVLINDTGYRKNFFSYLLTALLAGGVSMITILPMVMDLSANGESLTAINQLFTPDVGVWDIIAKNMVGVYDTSQYESMPFIYIGLLPLIFCLYYLSSKKVSFKRKAGYLSLFILLVASFYIYPLNMLWHGFHSPNMFLFRFSFLFSFLVILLAGYGLEKFTKEESNTFVNVILSLGAIVLIFVFVANKIRYDVITSESLVLTITLLVVYLVLGLMWGYPTKIQKWIPILLVCFMVFEAGMNAKYMVSGIRNEWKYPARTAYTGPYDKNKALVEIANEREGEDTFFRLENIADRSTNSSFNLGYNGVTMFSSIRNRHSSQYLNALGFRSLGTNLTISYENNTLLADSLVGIKYNIAKEGFNKFGYEKVAENGSNQLYENKYALPLGILTDDVIYIKDAVDNQTELLNHLSGENEELFTFGKVALTDTKNAIVEEKNDGTTNISNVETGVAKEVTWLVTVPAKKQTYLSIVPTTFYDSAVVKFNISVNGVSKQGDLISQGQYYDLGYYEEPQQVEVKLTFQKEVDSIDIYSPEVVFLDTELFANKVEKIKEKGIDFEVSGRKAKAAVKVDEAQVLLTTIPYDKGWKVLIDGKKSEIKTFKDAFLSIEIPAGEHEIEFVFLPQGFIFGLSISISCLLLFFVYLFVLRKKQNEHVKAQSEVEK